MDEDEKSGENSSNNKGRTSPPKQSQQNRSLYNSWAGSMGRNRNSFPNSRNSTTNSVVQRNAPVGVQQSLVNSGNGVLLPPVHLSPNGVSPSSSNPSGSGLNGMRDVLDDLDSPLPYSRIGENTNDSTSSSQNSKSPTSQNTSNSSGGNVGSVSPQNRVRGHRNGRRRTGRAARPEAVGSNSTASDRNVTLPPSHQSPSRRNRPPREGHENPLQLQFHSQDFTTPPRRRPQATQRESLPSPVSPDLFSPSSSPAAANPFLRGLGTVEEPYELTPRLPDVPSSPSAFAAVGGSGSSSNQLSDEEIARQLQQEEWESASNHGDDTRFSMRNYMSHFVSNPRRRQHRNLPPIRHMYEGSHGAPSGDRSEFSSRHYGGPRPPGRTSRGRGSSHSVYQNFMPNHLDDAGDIGLFIQDLFHSYNIPDFEIEALLNPNQFEDPDLGYESLLALAERVGEVSRGMSESDINKLPTTKHSTSTSSGSEGGATASAVSEDSSMQCNICLTDYEHGDRKRNLPCKHDFHKDCVDQWLKSNATCPICRSEVKPKRS